MFISQSISHITIMPIGILQNTDTANSRCYPNPCIAASRGVGILWNAKRWPPSATAESSPSRLHNMPRIHATISRQPLWVSVFCEMRNCNHTPPIWPAEIVCCQLCCRLPGTYTNCWRPLMFSRLWCSHHRWWVLAAHRPSRLPCSLLSTSRHYCPSITYSFNFMVYKHSIEDRFISFLTLAAAILFYLHWFEYRCTFKNSYLLIHSWSLEEEYKYTSIKCSSSVQNVNSFQ